MAYGDLKVRNLIWNTGSGDNTVVLSTLLTGSSPNWTGTATGVNLTLSGDLQVNGTTTTINTQTLDVEDHNITLGKVTTPSDTTANNGGITLKGASDKTFNWVNATDAWTSSEHIHLGDNKKFLVGTGSDLQIYHNGTDSNILNSQGDFYIQNTGSNADDINIRAQDDINIQVQNGEAAINCIGNGAVELYYDNSKKFETISSGIKTIGSGNVQLRIGSTDASGAAIYLDGDSNGDVSGNDYAYIRHDTSGRLRFHCDNPADVGVHYFSVANSGTTNTTALMTGGGSVDLYYDGVKTFETTGNGVSVIGPEGGNAELQLFSDEGDDNADKYKLVVDGSVFYIQNYASGAWESNLKATGNGAVELYYDNSKKFETGAAGVTVTGNIYTDGNVNLTADNKKIRIGAGEDLQLYHDGSNSYVRDVGTGTLWLDTNGPSISLISDGSVSNGKMGRFYKDGAVELYYDNSKKLETTSGGVNVTGALTVNGSAIGGGTWEILGTTDFASNNGNNSINTGWPSTYTQVKCVLNGVGNASNSDLSMQWYFNSSYGSNGTLNTQSEYKYAARWRQFDSANESSGNNDSNAWRFRNGGGSVYWNGEITFDIAAMAKDLKKGATAVLRTGTLSVHDSCLHDQSATEDEYIVGAKIFEHAGNNFTEGRVTWYGLKYA